MQLHRLPSTFRVPAFQDSTFFPLPIRINHDSSSRISVCMLRSVQPSSLPQHHPIANNNIINQLSSSLPQQPSQFLSTSTSSSIHLHHPGEEFIKRIILDCRFFTLLAVIGSLTGSLLCFLKGCRLIFDSFNHYLQAPWRSLDTENAIILLVEAIDVYMVGTLMLIFGMGLHHLFINRIVETKAQSNMARIGNIGSNLFGMFYLNDRPSWLDVDSVDELKTKVGDAIVMILLVEMAEKSTRLPLNSCLDIVCISASILLSSACIFLLSKLKQSS